METKVKYNFDRLNTFAKNMESFDKKYIVRVGIMGAKDHRGGGGSNATIGAAHEYGSFSRHLPVRSFLRGTLARKQNEIIRSAKALAWQTGFHGGIHAMFEILGTLCVRFVLEAFDSSGFSDWPALKKSTIKRKIGQNPQPLVNTGQMRRAVSFDVKARSGRG